MEGQARRLDELRVLSEEELSARIQRMRQTRNLPRLSYHFGQHGEAVGAGTPTEFNEMFGRHVGRGDLRYFTFIRRIGDMRM